MYKIKEKPEDFLVEEISNLKLLDKGKYSCLILEKKDFDTEKALQKISDYYNLNRKRIGFAGNKDRHAVTKQHISVLGKIEDKDFGDFKVKNIGFLDKPISLGDLSYNRFDLIIRNISERPEKTDFIINYFDEQRFSRCNLEIGLSILKNDFKKACELIDFHEVKSHLLICPKDYVGAVKRVPYKVLTLYLHALQSYLWNRACAEYLMNSSQTNYSVAYRHGKFIFPEVKLGNIEIPLVTFDTEFSADIKGIYEKVLSDEKIALRDFIIRKIPDLTPMGNTRGLIADVKDMELWELEEDEMNPGMKKIRVTFSLSKGSYATIAIKKIMRL
jgi:tRNA pseudouridine13 synthase